MLEHFHNQISKSCKGVYTQTHDLSLFWRGSALTCVCLVTFTYFYIINELYITTTSSGEGITDPSRF